MKPKYEPMVDIPIRRRRSMPNKIERGICLYRCDRPVVGDSRYCEIHQEYERKKTYERFRAHHPVPTPEHLTEVRRAAAQKRWNKESHEPCKLMDDNAKTNTSITAAQ